MRTRQGKERRRGKNERRAGARKRARREGERKDLGHANFIVEAELVKGEVLRSTNSPENKISARKFVPRRPRPYK